MPSRIILLSGPINAGKTTVGDLLNQRFGFVRLKTNELIRKIRGTQSERAALQEGGESLDKKTQGRWVADALVRETMAHDDEVVFIVDAVRIKAQIDHIRDAFGARVVHVHLTAPEEELTLRYEKKASGIQELPSYADARANTTERAVEDLADFADIVVDTARSTPEEVLVRLAAQLGLYGRSYERLVDVLVGGQYGSEGKGHIASYLAEEYDVLVRVGGPNAGHKVFGRPKVDTFHMLPSGTRRNARATVVIGAGAVLHVPSLLEEIAMCECSQERLAIDPQAMIIEDADREEEKKLVAKIGSTGQGVGLATARKILRTNADPAVRLAKNIADLKPYLKETRAVLEDAYSSRRRVMLEGTQGTALSIHHGYYPHVTSRDTTVSGCLAEAGIAPSRVRRVVMVCRTYPIRVGNPPTEGETSGPMSKETTLEEISRRSGVSLEELQRTEKTSTTKRDRRIAEFDWVLLRKAASLNGPTDIALTFTDYLDVKNREARRFEQLNRETIRFIEEVERVSAAPVSLISTRFHFRGIIDRRSW